MRPGNRSGISVSFIFALTLVGGSAWAHHNMSAIFDFNNRVALTGTLSKIMWTNPHVELIVETKDGDTVATWSLEGPSPSFFRSRSVGKVQFTAAIGHTVTAEASRARDGSLSALLRMITLPDGTVVSLCPQNC